jgi:hypothetical protein
MAETHTLVDLCTLMGADSERAAMLKAKELATLSDGLMELTKADSAEAAMSKVRKWKVKARKFKKARRKLKAALKAGAPGVSGKGEKETFPELSKKERATVADVRAQLGVSSAAFANSMRARRDVDGANSDVLEDFVANKLTKDPEAAKS